jgi:hypothetical protein
VKNDETFSGFWSGHANHLESCSGLTVCVFVIGLGEAIETGEADKLETLDWCT